MTRSEVESLAKTVVDCVKQSIDPLKRRINELESMATINAARIKSLEARPHLRYAGIFREGERYTAGALVTRSGSLWLAIEDTDLQPGEGASGWRLIVKKGSAV